MTDRIINLHALMVRMDAIGCWKTADLLREIIAAELAKIKAGL